MDTAPVAERPQPASLRTADLARARHAGSVTGTDSAPDAAVAITAADLAAIEGLQRLHADREASAAVVTNTATTVAPDLLAPPSAPAGTVDLTTPSGDAARCPMPAALVGGATACPVGAGARTPRVIHRTPADLFMRRLLRIADTPTDLSDATTYRAFRRSMLISAVRCTLTYLVFPFVLPALTFAHGYGPAIGVAIGSFALVCDTFSVRRFFAVDHRYRWHFSVIALSIMGLLTVLLVQDVAHVLDAIGP